MTETDLIPRDSPGVPVNIGNAFDLALPLVQRSEALLRLLQLAAWLSVERDELTNPDAYADNIFREQEIMRRTLQGIEDLRQAANMLELRWAMQNGHETWVDSSGAQVSLLDVIEGQMPNEDERRSSGRARQMWAFAAGKHSAVAAFREAGIPDQKIAECNASGMPSVLGIVSSERKKLEAAVPAEDLQQTYLEFIEEASKTTRLSDLKKWVRERVDPDEGPPPKIVYSAEKNCEQTWVVARLTEDQYLNVFWARMGDMLEQDRLLPEDFVRFWRSEIVPPGHTKQEARAGRPAG